MTIRNALPELEMLPGYCRCWNGCGNSGFSYAQRRRGNSGVILSLLFRGLSKGLSGKTEVDGKEYCAAFALGVQAAYSSVMKPTEGTVLTVARESCEAATKFAETSDSIQDVFNEIIKHAEISLNNTPNLLPVLAKAGVVDAGGMGLLVILKGMNEVISGKEGIRSNTETATREPVITNAAGSFETDIEFTYCTEFIVDKAPDCKDASLLRAFLETIGDSVVVVDDDDIIKVHVHTDHPGQALEEGLLFGQLINLKIENMREQHKKEAQKVEHAKKNLMKPVPPEKEYGFVSVVSGAGLEELFTDLGVDTIVRGGQTSNPSTQDILNAIMATPAHNVFVLPNNKNIIMAAEQAVKLADRNVYVLQSRSIPQGISAMLAFNGDLDVAQNSVNMTEALDKVGTGTVTYAVRDSDFEGKNIKKGDILAMENGKLAFTEKDITKALLKITKKLIKSDSSFVTVIYGVDVKDDAAQEAYEYLAKLGDDIGWFW